MNNNDFIREIRNFMDRFFAEWISLNSEYEKSIGKELEEMEKEDKWIEIDLKTGNYKEVMK